MIPKKRCFRIGAAVLLAALLAACTSNTGGVRRAPEGGPVANVIVMVPDGCDPSVVTLARWVKGAPLHLDGIGAGMVKTHMANSVITGSAAAATAFAAGHKTSVGFVGVGPSPVAPNGRRLGYLTGVVPTAAPFAPIASVLEGAKQIGKSTGLVATSRITHATPAAFAAHVDDRDRENDIMEQLVHQDLDVVFGGGARHLIPAGSRYETTFGATWRGKRTDGENLLDVLEGRGVRFIDHKAGLPDLTGGPVWGLFAESHMDPDIDRDDLHPTQPSLPEMTEAAIELLSQNSEGFFLLVEGSQIDWAAHTNDAAYMVSEFLAFDEAVGKALSFARSDGRTLVLVFPDHNTGGLSIGHGQSGRPDFPPDYLATSVEALIDPIKDAGATVGGLLQALPEGATGADVQAAFTARMGDYWRKRLSTADAAEIAANKADPTHVAALISRKYTAFGWTSHGHTGEDVPLWAFGPGRPVGTFDNTELAGIAADAMGIDLARASARLFVDVSDTFPDASADNADPKNPVLIVDGAELPVNRNIVRKDGSVQPFGGIVVHAPAIDKFFIPMEAVRMIQDR
jgi:alkaline phosphatase